MYPMNTSKPITISYLWDRENFEKSFENAYRWQYKNSARRYIGWLFIAMAQFGVVAALKQGQIGLLMLSTILLFYWYVGKKWLVRRRAVAAFENSPLKDTHIRLKADERGIEQEGRLISWEEIDGVVEAGEDMMLYLGGKSHYLPGSGFESLEAKSRLKSIARSKGKLYD